MNRTEIRTFARSALVALDNVALTPNDSLELARFDLIKIWLFGRLELRAEETLRLGLFIHETASLGESVVSWQRSAKRGWGDWKLSHWRQVAPAAVAAQPHP